MHIPEREKCNWIRERIEVKKKELPKAKKAQILERLAFAEKFEAFCANKVNTKKTFLTLIP